LVLGGLLTDADLFGLSWRTIFLINTPIALVALIAAIRIVPETRERSANRPDLLGAVLLTAAIVAVAYPLLEGRSLGRCSRCAMRSRRNRQSARKHGSDTRRSRTGSAICSSTTDSALACSKSIASGSPRWRGS
jgi:MFS family permease